MLTTQHSANSDTGKGKFGIVYVAQESISSKAVAIKFISKQVIFENKCLKRIQQVCYIAPEILE